MKPSIITATGIICLTIFTVQGRAQEIVPEPAKAPKFVIGLQGNVVKNSYRYGFPEGLRGNTAMTNAGAGVFARYYIGRHLALQTGVDFNPIPAYASERGRLYAIPSNHAIEIPLSLQYHLLKPDSKIRPYFGLGITNRINNYEPQLPGYFYAPRVEGFVLFEQGISWQVSRNLQFNQAVQYKFNYSENSLGIKLGLGYTIR